MADFIRYKGKTELDALAAWCKDHASAMDILRRLFAPDVESVKETIQTFEEELGRLKPRLENPDLLGNLSPNTSWKDAKTYMAQLVCYVWNNVETYDSNTKAADYVYRVAREGSRLYVDCCYARTLLKKYGKQVATVRKEAKLIHARETHFKKTKWGGMERPPTRAQLVKASREREAREARKGRRPARH